jgi:hypothetical protein
MLGLFLSNLCLFHMSLYVVDGSMIEIISVEYKVHCIFVCLIGSIRDIKIKAQSGLCKDKRR